MKKLMLFLALCASSMLHASVLTATVSDTDSQAWNNCAWTASLYAGGLVPTVSGVRVSPLTVTGSCSSSGVITGTFTDTSTVDQKPAAWVFTVTPNTSGNQSVKVTTSITGSSPDLTASFSGLKAPRFSAVSGSFGYLDVEASNPTLGPPASQYFNVTNQVFRSYTQAGWQGSGGGAPVGPAGTAQITNGTALAASDKTTIINGQPIPDYVDVANFQLAKWMQSMHNASNSAAHLKLIGDSYMICDNTLCATGPTISTDRWPEQIRISLQAAFGYGGTGMMPLSVQNNGLNINSENYPTTTGSLDKNTGTLGPSNAAGNSNALIHLPTAATVTFQPGNNIGGLIYDTLVVYCMTNASSGTLAVSIDGGGSTALTVCNTTSGSATAHAVSVSAGSLGVHSAVITSTGNSYIYAMEGIAGTTGIRVSNLGYGGADSTYFGATASAQLAFSDLEPAGTQGSIVMLQTNDIFNNITPSTTFLTDMTAIVTHELGLASTPSVMLAVPPVSGITGTFPASAYTAQQMAIYQSQPIDLVNIQWQWGTTYNGALPIWNGNHPSGAGSRSEASIVASKIVDNMPEGGPSQATSFGATGTTGPNIANFGFANSTGGVSANGMGLNDGTSLSFVTGGVGTFLLKHGSNFYLTTSGLNWCWNSLDNITGGGADTCFHRTAANEVTCGSYSSSANCLFKTGSVSVTPSTPADTATCTPGQIYADTGFIYVCTASGTVKRAALSTF